MSLVDSKRIVDPRKDFHKTYQDSVGNLLQYIELCQGKARDIFISEIDLDKDTWLRAKAWALLKAMFELCQIEDKNSPEALVQKIIMDEVIL